MRCYRLAELVLGVEHRDDKLFRRLQRELLTYEIDTSAKPDAIFSLRGEAGFKAPPRGAVRRFFPVGGGEVGYAHDGVEHLQRDDVFQITFDFAAKRVCVGYYDVEPVAPLARHALKWLVIKVAQQRGLTYIHGSAARYAGRNIVFSGGAGAGKSSCLFRLKRAGALVISDDNVLLNGSAFVPFTLKMNMKGDFAERFGLQEGWSYDLAPELCRDAALGPVDLIVFPRVWYHPRSEVRTLAAHAALDALFETYLAEHVYGARPQSDAEVREAYRVLVERTPCYQFDFGYDEAEVRLRLLEFLETAPGRDDDAARRPGCNGRGGR